jgi:hypothetical protein
MQRWFASAEAAHASRATADGSRDEDALDGGSVVVETERFGSVLDAAHLREVVRYVPRDFT